MSIMGNTAPIAVTPAGPGVENMVEEKGIGPWGGRVVENFLQIAMNAIFNYILGNVHNGPFSYGAQNSSG